MEVFVLNPSFELVGVIDDFESMVWTDRYSEAGEFEISTYPSSNVLEIAKVNNYLYNKDSDHGMIIESLNLTSDAENGDRLVISGRSYESILERRIVWDVTDVSGKLETGIKKILDNNVIVADASRKIPGFIFQSSGSAYINGLSGTAQYTGDVVYDVIKAICDETDIGFKVTLNNENKFVFQLYYGTDRSYNQNDNQFVVFSPSFENIINSSYLESNKDYKNVALIAGEDKDTARKRAGIGNATGLDRRELYVDARDIQSEKEDGSSYTDAEYINLLKKRGNENLAEHKKIKAFEGDVETTNTYVYGKDYFLGDVVQISNQYGHGTAMRVSEVVFSQDQNGIYTTPTFRALLGS